MRASRTFAVIALGRGWPLRCMPQLLPRLRAHCLPATLLLPFPPAPLPLADRPSFPVWLQLWIAVASRCSLPATLFTVPSFLYA